jgi:K+-transporting ATPase c subunit
MADKVQESGDKQVTVKIVDESTSSYNPDITPSAE